MREAEEVDVEVVIVPVLLVEQLTEVVGVLEELVVLEVVLVVVLDVVL